MKNLLQIGGDMATQTIERQPELTEQEVNRRVFSPQTEFVTPFLEPFSLSDMEWVEEQEAMAAPAEMVTYLPVPEPKNGILGRIARTMVAFSDWRHQDLFDCIFSDFFFEKSDRGFAAASR